MIEKWQLTQISNMLTYQQINTSHDVSNSEKIKKIEKFPIDLALPRHEMPT